MAVFTAIAAAVVSAIGITGTAATIFTAIGSTILSVGASRLLMKRQMNRANSGGSGGARIQLPPATENKLPVVYGSAYIGGSVTDAKISSDNKTMWYCVAMAEVTDTGGYTFDTNNIYYNGLKVQFGSNGVVTGLINNTTPATVDTKMSGQIYIYLFQNGATSPGQNTSQTAQQIMQDSEIPSGQRWTSTDLMSDCAFAIIKVKYNPEKGTTSLGGLTARITNSLDEPGSVLLDYMQNQRYGCAIPTAQIDTASLTNLNTYSDYNLPFTPTGGGSATQKRYRINGPIATGNDCLTNLQILVDSCDSWLQYSEFLGQWRVIINQSYTDYTTISNLYLVDSNNLVGGINVAPINLNETFNQLEVAYPNESVRDQTDYQLINLSDYAVSVMSPNEALNKLDVDYPVVNTAVQSTYLGIRRLLQSREDLTITFQLDYSGIQVEAGDVIRVKQEVYGWDLLNAGEGKLFRVANVSEEKYSDGSLGVRITAFEYNNTIYDDFALFAFEPDPNTGIANPNIMDAPSAPRPRIDDRRPDGVTTMNIIGEVPNVGLFTHLEFNYGTNTNTDEHIFYKRVESGTGDPLTQDLTADQILIGNHYTIKTLGTTAWTTIGATAIDLSLAPLNFLEVGKLYIIITAGTTDWAAVGSPSSTPGQSFIATGAGDGDGVALEKDFVATGTGTSDSEVYTSFQIEMNDLPDSVYYWSVSAKNQTQGVTSIASAGLAWDGSVVSSPISTTICNVNSSGTTLTWTPANDTLASGGLATIISGEGELQANSFIATMTSNVELELNQAPSIALVNACVQFDYFSNDGDGGGITGNSIQSNTITFNNMTSSGDIYVMKRIANYIYQTSDAANLTVIPPTDLSTYGAVSTINTARPKYLDTQYSGTTTDLYPYYEGTSSTADGYDANSTGPFTPASAAQLKLTNGQTNVYCVEYKPYDGTIRIPVDENVLCEFAGQFVANVDCTIQFMSFVTNNTFPNDMIIDSESFDTYNLKANEPTRIDLERKIALESSTPGTFNTGTGFAMRLMTASANVYVLRGDFNSYQLKGGN